MTKEKVIKIILFLEIGPTPPYLKFSYRAPIQGTSKHRGAGSTDFNHLMSRVLAM